MSAKVQVRSLQEWLPRRISSPVGSTKKSVPETSATSKAGSWMKRGGLGLIGLGILALCVGVPLATSRGRNPQDVGAVLGMIGIVLLISGGFCFIGYFFMVGARASSARAKAKENEQLELAQQQELVSATIRGRAMRLIGDSDENVTISNQRVFASARAVLIVEENIDRVMLIPREVLLRCEIKSDIAATLSTGSHAMNLRGNVDQAGALSGSASGSTSSLGVHIMAWSVDLYTRDPATPVVTLRFGEGEERAKRLYAVVMLAMASAKP